MPFIVAELSANHCGSLYVAMQLVEECGKAGANAIKLQTWTPGTMVLDKTLVIESGPWAGRNMSELYEEAHTPWEWHKPLFEAAQSMGMVGFSSVFDHQALDFLESINCPMYKISSFDCTDFQLICSVAQTDKPMIISTGMATLEEAVMAFGVATESGCDDITMLKCTSAYPAASRSINLRSMRNLRFGGKIGFSDHTKGNGAAVAATALGADMIEKHVMLPGYDGLDAGFSATPEELRAMITECKDAANALGMQNCFGVSPDELPQLKLRKSIYIIKDMEEGEQFTPLHIGWARPALGLPISDCEKVIGRKAKSRIAAGTPMSWNLMM